MLIILGERALLADHHRCFCGTRHPRVLEKFGKGFGHRHVGHRRLRIHRRSGRASTGRIHRNNKRLLHAHYLRRVGLSGKCTSGTLFSSQAHLFGHLLCDNETL
jgi:hypothetical protein